ncbi:MAG: hypothetical protein WCB11_09270 [Terriglobales bacterium]|jgi:hypothetical protein
MTTIFRTATTQGIEPENSPTRSRRSGCVTGAMDEIDYVSDFEKPDHMATLASALGGLGLKEESEEAGKRAEELLERARKEVEGGELRAIACRAV